MPISPEELTTQLHGEIPLTRALGVRVQAWDGQRMKLWAPLAPNLNPTDTAFGGAISSMGILAGYCLLLLLLRERGISTRILIQTTTCEFLRPVDEDFSADAACPEGAVMEEFLATLQRKRRARAELLSEVHCRGMLAARHRGLYVAILF